MGMSNTEDKDLSPQNGYLSSNQIEDFKNRTRKLGDGLQQAQEKCSTEQEEREDRANRMRGMSLGIRLSSEMIAAIVVGTLMGYGLDYFLGTKPWFFIIFMLLGFVTGVFNVLRGFAQLQQVVKGHKGA